MNQLLTWIVILAGILLFGISATEASTSGLINCLQTPKENALAVFKQCKQDSKLGCKQLLSDIHQSNLRRCGFMSGKRSDLPTSNSFAFTVQRPAQQHFAEANRVDGERSRPWISLIHRVAWNDFLERYSDGAGMTKPTYPLYNVAYEGTNY